MLGLEMSQVVPLASGLYCLYFSLFLYMHTKKVVRVYQGQYNVYCGYEWLFRDSRRAHANQLLPKDPFNWKQCSLNVETSACKDVFRSRVAATLSLSCGLFAFISEDEIFQAIRCHKTGGGGGYNHN